MKRQGSRRGDLDLASAVALRPAAADPRPAWAGPLRGGHRTKPEPPGARTHRHKGHVAANLHAGNDRSRLIDVLTQILPFIGHPRTLNGLRVVDEETRS
jgi:alkylhydroperoxidase/carboxymuconolactone decarboxylase family protein YurZ